MIDDIMLDAEERMESTINNLVREFSKVRTGRANPNMLEHVQVDYYGVPTPVTQVGNISVPEPNQLVIKPYDRSVVKEIERSILAANLGVTPSNEGEQVRIVLPKLTEDTRKALVRDVKKLAEEARVAIRNIRRDANEGIKKLEKASELTEDDAKGYLEDVQELTDRFVENVGEEFTKKEKDLLSI